MTTTGRLVTLDSHEHQHPHEPAAPVETDFSRIAKLSNTAIGLLERWLRLVDSGQFINEVGLNIKDTGLATDTRKFLAVIE